MSQSTTSLDIHFSSSASLAGMVAHLKARGIFDELRRGVHIKQKMVKDSPQDKLLDILLNLLMRAHRWLAQSSPEQAARLQRYGIKRLIRDLAHINGKVYFDAQRRLQRIALSEASSLAKLMLLPLRQVLTPSSIDVILDKT